MLYSQSLRKFLSSLLILSLSLYPAMLHPAHPTLILGMSTGRCTGREATDSAVLWKPSSRAYRVLYIKHSRNHDVIKFLDY